MKRSILLIINYSLLIIISSCNKLDVFEKNVAIPNYEWSSSFQPAFNFNISDTATDYTMYIVVRHGDAYRYNNIWLNIGSQSPGDTMRYQRFELQLGNDSKGWAGTGMDDIWELRAPVTHGRFKFNKPGEYKFSIAQVMRENPLQHVMSIGIRVERSK